MIIPARFRAGVAAFNNVKKKLSHFHGIDLQYTSSFCSDVLHIQNSLCRVKPCVWYLNEPKAIISFGLTAVVLLIQFCLLSNQFPNTPPFFFFRVAFDNFRFRIDNIFVDDIFDEVLYLIQKI